MFGFGPLYSFVLQPRLLRGASQPRIRRSIIGTDIALAVIFGGLCWLVGWQAVLLVQAPPILLGGAAGVFLFYVQHQFEDTYWERRDDWSFAESALQGSSHLKLPQPLQFFTGNIGIHHVHHLNARIPNYNLQRAHDENEVFHAVPTLSLWSAVRGVRLKLWDEDRGRLVTFAEARPARARPVLSKTG
jgi:acyl-lipid omega-6 desaturase (Delta-12 desaturase)